MGILGRIDTEKSFRQIENSGKPSTWTGEKMRKKLNAKFKSGNWNKPGKWNKIGKSN